MPSLYRTLTLFSLKQLKHAAIIDQGKWGNKKKNKMKGMWYLERGLFLFWKGSQMSKYSIYHLNSSLTQILELRRSKHVFTICFSNMWHQPVTKLQRQSSFTWVFQSNRTDLGKDLNMECKDPRTTCIIWACCLSLSNLWTNSFDPYTTRPSFFCLLTFGIWWFIISWVTQEESGGVEV